MNESSLAPTPGFLKTAEQKVAEQFADPEKKALRERLQAEKQVVAAPTPSSEVPYEPKVGNPAHETETEMSFGKAVEISIKIALDETPSLPDEPRFQGKDKTEFLAGLIRGLSSGTTMERFRSNPLFTTYFIPFRDALITSLKNNLSGLRVDETHIITLSQIYSDSDNSSLREMAPAVEAILRYVVLSEPGDYPYFD